MFSSADATAKVSVKSIGLDCKVKIVCQYEGGKSVNKWLEIIAFYNVNKTQRLRKNQGKVLHLWTFKQAYALLSNLCTFNQTTTETHPSNGEIVINVDGRFNTENKTPMSLLTVQTKARSLFQTSKSHSWDYYAQHFLASNRWIMRFKYLFCIMSVSQEKQKVQM